MRKLSFLLCSAGGWFTTKTHTLWWLFQAGNSTIIHCNCDPSIVRDRIIREPVSITHLPAFLWKVGGSLWTSFSINFGGKLSFILSSVFRSHSSCLYNYNNYSRTLCIKSWVSYWDLIKFHYFAYSTERGDRGWKQAQRQGEDRVTLQITLLCPFFAMKTWS